MNSPHDITIELGKQIQDIQRNTSLNILPIPFRDDDAKFLRGPISILITSMTSSMSFENVGFVGLRLIAGRVISLDFNPHSERLSATDLMAMWTDLTTKLIVGRGFWLPSEIDPFEQQLSTLTQQSPQGIPMVIHGLFGTETLRVEVKPNDFPSYQKLPRAQWTYRITLSLYNSSRSEMAYAFAKQIRFRLTGNQFKSILMSQYPTLD
jgi:hypothetical protein